MRVIDARENGDGMGLSVCACARAGEERGARAGGQRGLGFPFFLLLTLLPLSLLFLLSSLDLVVAGTAQAVLMIEGYCDFLPEETMAAAVEAGAAAVATVAAAVDGLHCIITMRPISTLPMWRLSQAAVATQVRAAPWAQYT